MSKILYAKVVSTKGGAVFSYRGIAPSPRVWETNSFNMDDAYQKKYFTDMVKYLKARFANSEYKVIVSELVNAKTSDIDDIEANLKSLGYELDRREFNPASLERG